MTTLRTTRKPQYKVNPSANETTRKVIDFLKLRGYHVWRNNTFGIWDEKEQKYRQLQYQQRGVPDIIGFSISNARMISIEVKAGADVLSKEQQEYLETLHGAGGIAMVAHDFEDFLTKWNRRFPKNETV